MNSPHANRSEEFDQLKEVVKKSTTMIVGIDVAKQKNNAYFITAKGKALLRRMVFPNDAEGFQKLTSQINSLKAQHKLRKVIVGVEPTANYHKPLGEYLIKTEIPVVFVSSTSAKRNRETLDGRWDKNDAKDSANIADLIRQGKFLFYDFPSKNVRRLRTLLSLRRKLKKLKHVFRMRIRGHLLAQYFPEADPYYDGLEKSIHNVIRYYFDPHSIKKVSSSEFVQKVGIRCTLLQKRKLNSLWESSGNSVGCETNDAAKFEGSLLVHLLEEIDRAIKQVEQKINDICGEFVEYSYLCSIPGFGPIISAMTLGAIGDPFRFKNSKQVLKMAGLDLSASRSGETSLSAVPRISKKGVSELRYALYQSALLSTFHDFGFKDYFTRILQGREREKGIKTKMRVKIAAKMLVIAWTLMKKKEEYNSAYLKI